MASDVEMAEAEREVDRIEIFERGRQVENVEPEEDQPGDDDNEAG